jgi:serine protease Do
VSIRSKAAVFLLAFLPGCAALRAADLQDLWAERVKCTVAVEYFTETESERRTTVAYGAVVDANGTIILPPGAIDPHVPPGQLRDFKVFVPGDPASAKGEYLGQDAFTGWHFVRAEERIRARLVPVTAFAARGRAPVPRLGDEVWGIGLRPLEEDFAPYLLTSRLALVQSLPEPTGEAQQEVAGPGLPVFNRQGVFVGLALNSGAQPYMLYSQMNRGGAAVLLVDIQESSLFELADEVIPYVGRVPANVNGRPLAWLGADGLEPMGRDVADFLRLGEQSGAVVSEVLEGSPAERAGMRDRDIILAIDGKPLPAFKPNRYVTDYVEREVARRHPGDVIALTVARGSARVTLRATLGEEPTLPREALRRYFERIGFTAREFVYGDAVERRIKVGQSAGVVVHYVKPNTPASIAGLQPDDWIKEIDGFPARTFADAANQLAAIEADPMRAEVVLLVSRGNDTAVLRVKLK